MLRFSANLGFLWTDLPLPDAVRAAARAGFDAVECHFPYDTPVPELRAALEETGLPLLALNTWKGGEGQFGLAALPDAVSAARQVIDQAVDYAAESGAGMVHVMAGKAPRSEAAEATFRENLGHAVARAEAAGLTILIEPLNQVDVPGYFLTDVDHAARIARETGARIMLDCYHMAVQGLDPLAVYTAHRDLIGHVQFAAYPGRGDPAGGEVDLAALLPALADAGYPGAFGAEYRPGARVEDGLGWMARFRAAQS